MRYPLRHSPSMRQSPRASARALVRRPRSASSILALAFLATTVPFAASHVAVDVGVGPHVARMHGLGLAWQGGFINQRVSPRPALWQAGAARLGRVAAARVASSASKAPSRAHALTGATRAVGLPESADISQYNPPVADQGDVNDCVAWVTTYYMRGWYARRDGYYPAGGLDGAGSFAPMYLYSQIAKGQNIPTSFNATLDLQVAQGVDTRADYAQGDDDYTHGPTAAEQANAASYRISGYNVLFQGAGQGDVARTAIETAIAGGDPVGLGIPVYDNFWNADADHAYIDGTPGTNYGSHAVFATRYDANGVWVENQWGAGWGQQGWVELSWSFVDQYAWQAVTIRPLAGPAPAAPSATAAAMVPSATVTSPTSVSPSVTATATAPVSTSARGATAVATTTPGSVRSSVTPTTAPTSTTALSSTGHRTSALVLHGTATPRTYHHGLAPRVVFTQGPRAPRSHTATRRGSQRVVGKVSARDGRARSDLKRSWRRTDRERSFWAVQAPRLAWRGRPMMM